jgi:hypothetical protein
MHEPTQDQTAHAQPQLRVIVANDQAAAREPLAAVLALSEDTDVVRRAIATGLA